KIEDSEMDRELMRFPSDRRFARVSIFDPRSSFLKVLPVLLSPFLPLSLFPSLLFRIILIGLLWGSLAARVSAQETVSALTDRITDQADLLSAQTEQTLTTLLAAHEEATTNQVVVLTVPSLQGIPIENFALQVAEATGLGTAEKDNGVLLVVAVEDRKVRIEVGYGLEGVLPDVIASRIIREQIVPHFRDGAYERGIELGVLAVLKRLESQAEPADAPSDVVVEETAPVAETSPSFQFEWWEWIPFLYFLAVLMLACVAAALAVMEKMPERALYFLVLLPCFFFAGRSLGFFILWYFVPPWLVPLGVVGIYGVFFWAFARRYDSDPAFKAAWRRRLLVHGSVKETSAKEDAAASEEPVVSSVSPYPQRIQTLVVVAAATLLALFLYTRWLSVIWMVVGAVLAWFSLRRIAEDPEQRKRRGARTWVSSGSRSSRSSSSYRSPSSSRSYSSRSYSSSSYSSSSYSSSSSSSYSSSSSSSSFSGGGGSFGGGGASGSW
ncbi:MAG: YgcG family protein, partial [Rhodothermales bacterium]